MQILRQKIWFKCCHCRQSLDQRSDWLQMISSYIERQLISMRKLCLQAFLLVLKLSSQTFSSVLELGLQIFSSVLWRINLVFSVWLKKFKSLICCADEYLVNFTKNWKETSHLLWSEMKFWERWIMFLCFSRRLFEFSS